MNSTEYAKKKKYFLNHTMLQDWKRTTNQRKQHHLLSSEQDLVVRVVDPVGDETFFKVKRTTKMAKIFLAYATRKGVDVSSLIFLLDGEPIGETSI